MGEWVCAEFRVSFNRRVGMGGGKSKLSTTWCRKSYWKFRISSILNTFLAFPNISLFKAVICHLVSYDPTVFKSPGGDFLGEVEEMKQAQFSLR